MFNNISLGSIDIAFNNLNGTEDGKRFSVNGSISIGISVNAEIINKIEPLINRAIRFEENKFIGKSRIQKALDEVELLRLEVEKKRLEKQLRDLNK